MAIAAAPAAEAVAARAVAGRAAGSAARSRASTGAGKKISTTKKPTTTKKPPAKKPAPGGGGGKGEPPGGGGKGGGGKGDGKKKGGGGEPEAPSKGDRAKSWGKKSLQGSQGKYRRILVAEFIVCTILLGLSPLAKADGALTAGGWMKRGSATCAFFIILGLISSFGPGAGRAAAGFGGLVTLVLLVDQREAFGKLATMLNAPDTPASTASTGPPDSTDAPTTVQT